MRMIHIFVIRKIFIKSLFSRHYNFESCINSDTRNSPSLVCPPFAINRCISTKADFEFINSAKRTCSFSKALAIGSSVAPMIDRFAFATAFDGNDAMRLANHKEYFSIFSRVAKLRFSQPHSNAVLLSHQCP